MFLTKYIVVLLLLSNFTVLRAITSSGFSPEANLTEPCIFDYDCKKSPKQICSDELECVHKQVFPILFMEFIGIIIVSIILALSQMAGIGGGGLIVLIYMIFFDFTTKASVAITSFSILICSIFRYILNRKHQHPEKEAVCLEYGIASVMLPMVLVGSLIGVYINQLFPDLIIQLLLALTEGIMGILTGFKARTLFKKESKQKKMIQDSNVKGEEESIKNYQETMRQNQEENKEDIKDNLGIMSNDEGVFEIEQNEQALQTNKLELDQNDQKRLDQENQAPVNLKKTREDLNILQNGSSEEKGTDPISQGPIVVEKLTPREELALRKLLEHEKSHLGQWKKQLICLISMIVLILITLFRGSDSTESIVGLEKCGAGDWCILGAFVIIALGITWIAIRIVKSEESLKQRGGIKLASSDLEFDKAQVVRILLVGLAAGMMSGAFGIGGGVIYNFAFLHFEIPPKVTSATSMYLIMLSKFAQCFIFLVFGNLNIQYGCWLSFWCVLGTFGGLKSLDKVLHMFQRQSLIVVTLAFLMILSALTVPIIGGLDVKEQKDNGIDIFEFKALC